MMENRDIKLNDTRSNGTNGSPNHWGFMDEHIYGRYHYIDNKRTKKKKENLPKDSLKQHQDNLKKFQQRKDRFK